MNIYIHTGIGHTATGSSKSMAHAGIQTGIHTYRHTYMHTYIQAYIHPGRHTYRHTYIHTYRYIHTHRQADIQKGIHTGTHKFTYSTRLRLHPADRALVVDNCRITCPSMILRLMLRRPGRCLCGTTLSAYAGLGDARVDWASSLWHDTGTQGTVGGRLWGRLGGSAGRGGRLGGRPGRVVSGRAGAAGVALGGLGWVPLGGSSCGCRETTVPLVYCTPND